MAFNKDEIIFGTKSLDDLFSDIYKNSKNKQKKVDDLLDIVKNLVKGISDAAIVLPLLKEILDVGVKNDEQLIKLAGVIQRLLSGNNNNENTELISPEEKKQLLVNANINKQLTKEEDKGIDVDEQIKALEEKVKHAKKEVEKGDKKLLKEVDGKKK